MSRWVAYFVAHESVGCQGEAWPDLSCVDSAERQRVQDRERSGKVLFPEKMLADNHCLACLHHGQKLSALHCYIHPPAPPRRVSELLV